MDKVPAKIYFLISNGEVLAVTGEMQWAPSVTTKEEDMEVYPQLQGKNIDDIDYVELEYGTLASTFINIKSYSVDVSTKKLNCFYYTQEELDAIKLEQEVQQAGKQLIQDRINLISDYANLDTNSITELENSIIEYEQNKIMNGVE
ncbi:hypothetical protein [Clostridium diolis]|uniref:hypothetical protein n=1 Tax=Clostridium diolis TaxID=223919 RepID=UPI003AF4B76F